MQLTISAPLIMLCTQPVDFRKSIDGLVNVVLSDLDSDPRKSIYIFFNRATDRIKMLAWHKNGFVLLLKRLEKGHFFNMENDEPSVSVTQQQLGWLLAGLDWVSMTEWGELEFRDFS